MQRCRHGRKGRRWCSSRHRSHLGSRHCRSNAQVDLQAQGATASRKGCRRTAEPRRFVSRRGVARCLSRMHRNGAPRDAVLNPWHSQEELGGTFLGHRVYLRAKAGGDKSMPEKRGSLEGAKGIAPQGPRDRAKAGLLEPQSPAVQTHTRRYGASNAALPGAGRSRFAVCYLRLARRWPARPLKGMRGAPTSRSTRSAPPERGIAYRTRVPGRRSPRSSRRAGEPSTGRRGTGGAASQRARVRDGQLPEPSGCRPPGELIDTETVTISSERGRRKSAVRQLAGGLLYCPSSS